MMPNRFSHPCDVTDVMIDGLFDAMIAVAVAMLVDADSIVVASAAVTLEFAATVLYGLDVMGDMWAGVTIVIVTTIGVDLLAGVMTSLEFVLPALSEESKLFC